MQTFKVVAKTPALVVPKPANFVGSGANNVGRPVTTAAVIVYGLASNS